MTLETSLTLLLAAAIMVALLLSWAILFGAYRLLSSVRSPDRRPKHSIGYTLKKAGRSARRNSLPRAAGIVAGRIGVAFQPLGERVAPLGAAAGRGFTRVFGGVVTEQQRMARLAGEKIVHAASKTARKAKRVAEALREPDEPRPRVEPSAERRIRDLHATRGR